MTFLWVGSIIFRGPMEIKLPLLLALYAIPIVLGLCYFGSSTTPVLDWWYKVFLAPRHLEPRKLFVQNIRHYEFDWLDPSKDLWPM